MKMESSHGLMTNSPRKRSPASPRDHVDSYLNQPKKIGLKQSEYAAIRACREKEPEFLYQGILFISLAIPFGIMLAFGGKPALIVLCFGSIIAHIFDILGTLEGTLMAILICGLGLWATLVLSARTLLSESYVNFPLVIVMGLALVLIFIVICSNFRSLLNEFSNLFYVSEVLLFGTIPILSSSIIAWFLCVEIPNLDLSFCFSSTYALYVLLLNSPRKSSHPSSYTSTSYERIFVHTLPKNILLVVYSLPLFIGPLLHTVVTHNVIFDSWSRVSGVVTSFLLPSILILTCAENHIAYWKKEESPVILKNISNTKLILSAILFFLIQNHPIFDDIRKISNLPSPIASAILCGIAMLSSLVVYLHRLILVQFKESKLDDSSSRESTVSTTSLYVFSSLAAGCCGALVPIFLGLPNTVCYIAFQGALCANNFYRYSSNYRWKSCFAFITNYPIPVAFMMVSTKMVFFTFAFKTVVLSVFTFDWEPMPMTMFYFTFWLDSMVQLAVFAPTVAMGINHFNDRKLSNSLPIGEQTQSEEGVAFWSVTMTQIRCLSFSLILIAFNYWMAIAELIVREQDWSSVNAHDEIVYPSYLFGGTSLIASLTAIHLFRIDKIGRYEMWIIIVGQSCKLFHLLGLNSSVIAASTIIILAYTQPFILHGKLASNIGLKSVYENKSKNENGDEIEKKISQLDDDSTMIQQQSKNVPFECTKNETRTNILKFTLNPFLSIAYIVIAMVATYFSHFLLIHNILVYLLVKDPSYIQIAAASLSLFFTFTGVYCVAFSRSMTGPSRLFLLCAATCVLIALNALPLVLQLDSSSPTYLVLQLHPELSEDHEAIFVILSFLLLLAAGVKIVPLKSPLPRLFFLLTFSSTFARTLILFGFPLALNTNSPHHGIFQLPWLYCYLISFAGSFIAVQSSLILKPKNEMKENNDNDYIGSIFFLAFTSLPFLALAWSTITRTNEENLYGIIWIAAMCNGLLTVSVRSSEVNKDLKVRGGNGSGSGSGDDKRNDTTATTTSICVLSSVSGIVWTILASIITKSVSSDLTVPISCLLLLCVRRNLFNIDIHPFALSATASSFWWMTSSFYSIFFRGYAGSIGVDHFELNVGAFGDENVSIWNNDNLWYPGLNLVLILVPLPAIYLGVIRRKGESEDVLFIFALLSVLSIVAAQCSSIRLLGVAGVAFGSWRCYDVGQIQADSNRLI